MLDDEEPRIGVVVIVDHEPWDGVAGVENLIERAAMAVADRSEVAHGVEATVLLSSDDNVAELNQRFRGKAGPTNVLSFPPGPGADAQELGDIALAYETVAREAAEQGTSIEHHVQHLIVHGILHLLGYDHETPQEAERMETLEIEVLSSLGIANPYTGALETGMNG